MDAISREAGGLSGEIVGPARVTAFGTSLVAPAGSVVTVLVIVVSYAGFASPLVILITFVASLCCATDPRRDPGCAPCQGTQRDRHQQPGSCHGHSP
jgi:hypothetical protein